MVEWLMRQTSNLRIASRMGSNPVRDKPLFLFKCHNSKNNTKNHSIIKLVKYAQEHEEPINPVHFNQTAPRIREVVWKKTLKTRNIRETCLPPLMTAYSIHNTGLKNVYNKRYKPQTQ